MLGVPTYDIETVSWKVPISVGFFDGVNYHEFIKENEDDDVIWKFLSFVGENFPGIKIFAHCAASFDNKFVLAALCNRDEPLSLEAGLARLKWLGPDVTFMDSYLLIPMSLRKIGEMLEVGEKEQWDHNAQLKPWEMGDKLTAFKEYQRTDCILLSKAIHRLSEELGMNFGVVPSISISTTAVKAFDKYFYGLNQIDSNEQTESFIRAAIYGGRNEVYKRYGENINVYDINSMYVSCYDVPIPIGKMRWIKGDLNRGTLIEASVKVPTDLYIGPLPHHYRGRLVFPTGEFKDWWDARELKNAVDNFGVDVIIRRQLCADEVPVLKEFGSFVSKLRQTKLRRFWKIFGLSICGKFGQGRWRDVIHHSSEIKDFTGYSPLDKDENYFKTIQYVSGRNPYIKPAVAMRIRAEARIRHLNLLSDASKRGDVYYSDTDSIFTNATFPTSDEPGHLTNWEHAKRGYFIRPKLYGVVTKKSLIQRSAGYSDLKLNENDFKGLLEGTEIQTPYEELGGLARILKTQEVELLKRRRKVRASVGYGRVSIGDNTRPLQLPEKVMPDA